MADLKSYVVAGDEGTDRQIEEIASSPAYEGETIRIMPDAHFGKGSCVGFTSTHSDKIVPNTVGVDIACRVSHLKLPMTMDDVTVEWLDRVDHSIGRFVPAGFRKRKKPDRRSEAFPYDKVHYWQFAKKKWDLICSMGTLGGGNHYIELDRDEAGNVWLAVHTGSRNFGLQVCNYYQGIANQNHPELGDLAYIEGEDMDHYLNDMVWCNEWSLQNHLAIIGTILVGMRLRFEEDAVLTCIHNYVDVEHGYIRKGAISAQAGEIGAIPLNMRDGTLLVRGARRQRLELLAPPRRRPRPQPQEGPRDPQPRRLPRPDGRHLLHVGRPEDHRRGPRRLQARPAHRRRPRGRS